MNKKQLVKYIVITAVLCIMISGAFLLFVAQRYHDPSSIGMGLTVDPESGVFVPPEESINEDEGDSGIAIPGWDRITIEAGKTEAQVNLKNPEENEGKYDMRFTLYLAGEEKPFAQTGLIKAGESALKLNLSQSLATGEYPVRVHVQPYRVSDKSATNNADILVTLHVR